jgi:hypothetical protein
MSTDVNPGRCIDKLPAVQKAAQLERYKFTHRALSRTSRSHDAIELKSSQAKRESKKGNLQNNDVSLFQFLGFYILNLKKWVPKGIVRVLSLILSFRIGFSPVISNVISEVVIVAGRRNRYTHS